MSNVVVTERWHKRSLTTLMGTRASSRREAWVCRSVCSDPFGRPAFLRRAENRLLAHSGWTGAGAVIPPQGWPWCAGPRSRRQARGSPRRRSSSVGAADAAAPTRAAAGPPRRLPTDTPLALSVALALWLRGFRAGTLPWEGTLPPRVVIPWRSRFAAVRVVLLRVGTFTSTPDVCHDVSCRRMTYKERQDVSTCHVTAGHPAEAGAAVPAARRDAAAGVRR